MSTPKSIPPALGVKSFTCPHCGAIAHQTWFRLFAHSYGKKDEFPFIPDLTAADAPATVVQWARKMQTRKIFHESVQYGDSSNIELHNCYISRCYSCSEWAVWVADNLAFPVTSIEINPNEDMPHDIKLDFIEANSIINLSPRGAAALLRLCIQKLVIELGEKGDNLNADIAALVRRGLDPKIQQSLDLVRVIGNEAVHPGQIDLRDDKPVAIKLFGLVNLVVEVMIAAPKHIAEMYETVLPESKREQIQKRDAPKDSQK